MGNRVQSDDVMMKEKQDWHNNYTIPTKKSERKVYILRDGMAMKLDTMNR